MFSLNDLSSTNCNCVEDILSNINNKLDQTKLQFLLLYYNSPYIHIVFTIEYARNRTKISQKVREQEITHIDEQNNIIWTLIAAVSINL